MVAPNGIYRLTVFGNISGQAHLHTLHFRSTTAGNAVGLSEFNYQTDLLAAWKAAAQSQWKSLISSNHTACSNYQVRKVCGSLPLPAGVDSAETAGQTGGSRAQSGENDMAPWLAQNVTWRTGFAGKSFRGRSFVGGLYESDVTVATIGSPRMTSLTTYCNALVTAFVTPLEAAVNWKLFVYSPTLAKQGGIACQNAGADITGFQVRDQMASMKSRKAGSGP